MPTCLHRLSLVAADGITPPIWFGQGSDPEILGTVTVGVHHLLDLAPAADALNRLPAGIRWSQDLAAQRGWALV